jgi:putative membrane protein
LAYERTLMAWIRTATSLITFGFSIYKFFQIDDRRSGTSKGLIGPREFALLMVAIGIVSLLAAITQHRRQVRALNGRDAGSPRSLASMLAALIGVLGFTALIAVVFRQ